MADVRGGNEVEIRGRYIATPTDPLTDQTTQEILLDSHGCVKFTLWQSGFQIDAGNVSDNAFGGSSPFTLDVQPLNLIYNGSSWDRQRTIEAVIANPLVKTGVAAVGVAGWDGINLRNVEVRSVNGHNALTVHDHLVRRLLEEILLELEDSESVQREIKVALQKPDTPEDGYSLYKLIAAGSTNATNLTALPTKVHGWFIHNASAATRFLKLYDMKAVPTVGTDIPDMTIPIPAGASANVEYMRGIQFLQGLSFALTVNGGDTDSTAVTASDVYLNLLYKQDGV